jgi:predicted transcriptional regulator
MFLHEKTVEIMLKILEAEENGKNAYPLGISKEVGSPYSYISKVLSEFEENALIESEFKGRIRVVRFTEEGRKIAEMLRKLKSELSKDFVSRRKLSILRNAVKNAQNTDKEKVFRVLAPVKAELESLKKEARDEETLKMIESLEKEVEGML